MSSNRRRSAFTLIEVLIVVVIMAVLAATIIPQFSSSTKDAKESSLSFNLHTLRSQIGLYKAHHLGKAPTLGTEEGGFLPELVKASDAAGDVVDTADPEHPYGPYIDEVPANPFTGSNAVAERETEPASAGDANNEIGWFYNATTGEIWPSNSEYYTTATTEN